MVLFILVLILSLLKTNVYLLLLFAYMEQINKKVVGIFILKQV
jgi:hypothetical protein